MTTLLIYILKWALSLALLYIPFAIMLRKETFAKLNRILLLGIIVISSLLPLVEITFPVEVMLPTGNFTAITENGDMPTNAVTATATKESITLLTWRNAGIIYITGVICSLLVCIVNIVRLRRSMRHGMLWYDRQKGIVIHCHANGVTPFSWFNHIVISERDYNECGREILLHEEGHIRNLHSWDMLFLNLIKALQWFNPFIYILAADMKDIHEYEADRYVLEHHCDTRAYQLLILRKAIGDTQFTLANNFSQSSTRKRITMMARKRSGKWSKGKILYVLPTALATTLLFAKPEYIYSTPQVEIAAKTPDITVPPNIEPTTASDMPAVTEKKKTKGTPIKKQKIAEVATTGLPAGTTCNSSYETPAPAVAVADEGVRGYVIEPYYEFININSSGIGDEAGIANIGKCSIRVCFTCNENGRAENITTGSCNISIKGNDNEDMDVMIEHINNVVANAARAHVTSKEWFPITVDSNTATLFEVNLTFHHGDNSIIKPSDVNRPLLVGLTPVK